MSHDGRSPSDEPEVHDRTAAPTEEAGEPKASATEEAFVSKEASLSSEEKAQEVDELDDEARAVLEEDDEARAMLDDVDLRDLFREALKPPPGSVAPSLLGGVQSKIRHRSRGKFYGDGWSTARSPRSTYLVTSALMLLIMTLVYFVLIPWGMGAFR